MGIPGSGKTTLARWISGVFEIPAFDLDHVVYDDTGQERRTAEIVRRVDLIRACDGWVTEGAYQADWLRPLLEDAATIIWLDASLPTAAVRILKRHVRAELSGNNQHAGWGKFIRFLNCNRLTARQQRAETAELLAEYSNKVFHCRASRDVASFQQQSFPATKN
jgi:adenylate kinase family enzyme